MGLDRAPDFYISCRLGHKCPTVDPPWIKFLEKWMIALECLVFDRVRRLRSVLKTPKITSAARLGRVTRKGFDRR